MNWHEGLSFGIHELKAYKLRSFLTILGIVFGVGAVIAMVSISQGARREALDEIALLGMRSVRVRPLELSGGQLLQARQKGVRGIGRGDVAALVGQVPGIAAIAPVRLVKEKARKGDRYSDAAIVGTTSAYTSAVSYLPGHGRFLTQDDEDTAATVCVIGEKVRRDLFPFADPVGHSLTIGTVEFVVVGVMEEKSLKGARRGILDARDINRDVYIPLRTAMRRFESGPLRPHELDEICIRIEDTAPLQESAAMVRRVMELGHKGMADFDVVIPEELLRQAQKSQRIFNVVMGAIAGISLVVGGIGIMNIMLATVTQRTREIGIRRALGARRDDLLLQFLLESIMLSFVGGLHGIVLGVAAAFFIARFAQWVTVISPWAILLAVTVSTVTGVAFGYMPARRAADLDPIEALRHE